ncbi:MAG: hypothetical protein KatS3mg082_3038 [Nitrospiraceae bacterium]|nr:MAG: hypothetical protein KatS3mg082_3038 [Nitrospiraceae bacterium]
MDSFAQFFRAATGFAPYRWQEEVSAQGFPEILPVPTGLGKTEGAVLAWAWRLQTGKGEPRHLVYCLPMRTLVRQTVERLRSCLSRSAQGIPVYQLMGGALEDEWVGQPERPWVLVGTQDQLLSRALNRGYAMNRFEWPVHFGLLNNDCRWIVDEVQLMGPGLWTTAQLDWMRRKRFGTVFDCPTTWMSATADSAFLATEDRKRDGLSTERPFDFDLIERDPSPEIQKRLGARKALSWWAPNASGRKSAGKRAEDLWAVLAADIATKHVPGTLSLVICNTVEAARRIYEALPVNDVPKILLTSRFRRLDRERYEKELLEFENRRREIERQRERQGLTVDMGKPLRDSPGLICVSTQVVEAGVDVSAHHLWSEVAPWPSVIQRLGRLNRDGRDQEAKAWFWEAPVEASRKRGTKEGRLDVNPYDLEEIECAKKLIDGTIRANAKKPFLQILKGVRAQHEAKLHAAVKPRPEPMPRAVDLHGLFSTEHDVHGGFTDVSAFVRGSDPNADLTVVWRYWESGPKKAPPSGDELDGPPLDVATEGCPVPIYRLRDVLKGGKTRAWIWNDEDDRWEGIVPDDLRPGMVVMLHRDVGGYSALLGWTGNASDKLDEVPRVGRGRALRDDELTETGYWATLDVHLADTRREAEQLCDNLKLQGQLRAAVVEAAALHDLGKAHPQWQSALPAGMHLAPGPWAKCPRVLAVDVATADLRQLLQAQVHALRPNALVLADERRQRNRREILRLRWALDDRLKGEELNRLRAFNGVLWAGHVPFRPNMRHEAASALAMWHRYRTGGASYPVLAVYLAAAHHGKVRTVLRSLTETGEDAFGVQPQPPHIAWDGQTWLLDFSVVKDGAEGRWTPQGFILDGYGWTGLVADLLGPWRPDDASEAGVVPESEPSKLGPFKLAYLEALIRIADWRASANPSECTKPSEVRRDG